MKKILFVVLALLLVTGIANATNIPQMVDPKNYPTVWTEVVYNGSGSDIASCHIVSWDFDTADSDAGTIFDDTAPWVKTTASAGDVWTAGVTTAAITNGNVGSIIIKGPAVTRLRIAGEAVVNTIAESNASGEAQSHDGAGVDEGTLGITIKASAAGNDIHGNVDAQYALIYVNPQQYDKD